MPLKKVIFFGLAGLLLVPVTAQAQERDALTKEGADIDSIKRLFMSDG